MKNNLISKLLKHYSLNGLATITGFDEDVLRMLRRDLIPDHITRINGKYIPAKSVLIRNINDKVKDK